MELGAGEAWYKRWGGQLSRGGQKKYIQQWTHQQTAVRAGVGRGRVHTEIARLDHLDREYP